jgi:hypothetical protein
MARTATQKPAVDHVGVDEGIPVAHAVTLAEEKILHIESQYTSNRDLANQVLGEALALEAVSKFSLTVRTSKLALIKENKLYRDLKGRILPDGTEFPGTWEGYCQLIGRSVDQVDEDIRNLNTFGEDALDSLHRIGAGYRELRKLRKLPEDVRQEVAGQLINLEDKEEIVALIDDMAARHAREKDELQKENAELKADAEANGQVISDKNAKLDVMEREIYKLRNKSGDWHPRVFEIANETNVILGKASEQLDKLDTMRDVILNEDLGEEEREAAVEMMACVYYDAVNQLIGRLAEISDACDQVFIGYKEKARPMLQVFAPSEAN